MSFGFPESLAHLQAGDDAIRGAAAREFLDEGHLHQPTLEPGDVVLFSEATVHGALPWTAKTQRQLLLSRFAPATVGYGRAYLSSDNDPQYAAFGISSRLHANLTASQRAVLAAPYALRVERATIAADGAVDIATRNPAKKRHDRCVFGTEYF